MNKNEKSTDQEQQSQVTSTTKKIVKIDPIHLQHFRRGKKTEKKEKKKKESQKVEEKVGKIDDSKIKSQLLANIQKRRIAKQQQQQKQEKTEEQQKKLQKQNSSEESAEVGEKKKASQRTNQNVEFQPPQTKFQKALTFLKEQKLKLGTIRKPKLSTASSSSSSSSSTKEKKNISSSNLKTMKVENVRKEEKKKENLQKRKEKNISKNQLAGGGGGIAQQHHQQPKREVEILTADWPEEDMNKKGSNQINLSSSASSSINTQTQSPYKVDNVIKYGNLKGGIKQTFRNLHNLKSPEESSPNIYKTSSLLFEDEEEFDEDLVDRSTKVKAEFGEDVEIDTVSLPEEYSQNDSRSFQESSESSSGKVGEGGGEDLPSMFRPDIDEKEKEEDNESIGSSIESTNSQDNDEKSKETPNDHWLEENDSTTPLSKFRVFDNLLGSGKIKPLSENGELNSNQIVENSLMNDENKSIVEKLTEKYGNKSQSEIVKKPSLFKKHNYTEKVKYNLGKNKTKRVVGVLMKNTETIDKIKEACTVLKNEKIEMMKKYLIDRNLLKPFSTAPLELIQELYETSYLTGDVANTQQLSLQEFKNYFDYKANPSQ